MRHTRISPCRAAAVFLAAVSLGAQPVRSQQDASFSGFQLNRSLPGARSLAMGGAFVALADDASAVYSNPAGLTILERPEVSVEGRSWAIRTSFTQTGRIDGAPTGIGLDVLDGELVRDQTHSTQEGLSFASFVYAAPDRRWALGVFHHTLADYSARFQSQGVFTDETRIGRPDVPIERFGPYRFFTELLIEDSGVSFAYQLGDCVRFEGCVRLGLSVASYGFELAALEEIFMDPPDRGVATFDGPPVARFRTSGGDDDVAASLGLLWEISSRWRLGLAVRQGPEFRIDQVGPGIDETDERGAFIVPDQIALGFSFKPSSALTISLEYDRVEYSSLTERNRLENFGLEDADELRAGGEYVLFLGDPVKPTRLAFMIGAWYDPDHSISFTSEGSGTIDIFRRAYFPRAGSDTVHWSAGVGLNLGRFQLDAGADLSDNIDTYAVSSVVRF